MLNAQALRRAPGCAAAFIERRSRIKWGGVSLRTLDTAHSGEVENVHALTYHGEMLFWGQWESRSKEQGGQEKAKVTGGATFPKANKLSTSN